MRAVFVALFLACPTVGALAADPAAVLARLTEIAPLRALRQAPAVPDIPAEAYAKVAAGQPQTGLVVVDGVKARKAWGAVVIDLPLGPLYAAVNDEIGAADYTPIEYTELLTGARCQAGRRVLQLLPIPLISDRWWITVLHDNPTLAERSGGQVREVWWTSSVDPAEITSARGREIVADDTPLGYTKGGWLVAAIDGGSSLLEYYVWTDPGGSIPAGPASSFAAGKIEDTFDAIRKFAAEGHPGCPDH